MNQPLRKGPIIAAAGGLAVLVALVLLAMSCGTVPQADVGFQVGGGALDPAKGKVKSDLLKPGRHILGLVDNVWLFPAYRTLRFQDFDVPVTTVDGKKVEVRGQMAFRFVGEHNPALAKDFAEGLGARKYNGQRPGEGNDGWTAFLDQLVATEISASLKDGFGRVYCADFEPACRSIDPRKDVPVANPERVYDEVSKTLQGRVDAKLGAPYLQAIRIRVQRITLPGEVQKNIDQVTEEQAKTKRAEQAAQTATQEARAITIKGRALRKNRQAIPLEIAKQCQGGDRCTLIVDASGNGVKTTVPAR